MRLRTSTTLAYALACSFAATVAHGADETGKGYINPMYGYQWADKARNVNDDDFWGVGVGRHISEHWSLELNNLVAHDFNGN